MTIWDCWMHVRMTMTSSVEQTDLDFKISVALVYTVCHSICICLTHHYTCMWKPHFSNFRINTAVFWMSKFSEFLGYWNFFFSFCIFKEINSYKTSEEAECQWRRCYISHRSLVSTVSLYSPWVGEEFCFNLSRDQVCDTQCSVLEDYISEVFLFNHLEFYA